ncbi:hypothetical protein SAMN05443287_101461 [Micromonospora phaseoli]|uniref:Uncharacterized protein n=1 Tax=Micromonospora phaseoli TaxID=1144548 RepID=A0A1H6S9A9_9ACTN|nr:hypothetical protein [Micromonospora phaseoli]PZW03716.1 hypothetical protein CLV64_101461 [Micromonospora phaseoli]GIJ80299.1 hypothetical protein Xph01_47310 [Micromonospora phaseoli]SEI60590.1 hypothetical protein SAMN05443287_101461 [Micromonospora phaseoli]
MKRLWRNALRIGVVLACLTGVDVAMAAPAQAAFATELGGLPDQFTAGGRVETVSAVVSRTDQGGCIKVRWSMVMSVRGLRLDQVRVDRIEETGSFPVEVRTEGAAARLTDRELDPGTLCPGRTVTAQYRIAFAGDVDQGRVSLAAEAYDQNLQLLSRQTATREVVGRGGAARPTTAAPTPSSVPTVDPTDEPVEVPTVDPAEEESGSADDVAAAGGAADPPDAGAAGNQVSRNGGIGLTEAAFLLGGLLLFLGVGLLLRLRQLTREPEPVVDGVGVAATAGRWERQPGARSRWRTVPRDGGYLS